MIQYTLKANYVNYKNPDKITIDNWSENFIDDNPIVARQNAIQKYITLLDVFKEGGEKVEDKLPMTGNEIESPRHGIGIYMEIIDPEAKEWNDIKLPFPPYPGFGNEIEKDAKHWVEMGLIDNEEEYEYFYEEYQFLILGVGDGIHANPDTFINSLENEIVIYDFFKFDIRNLETTVPCFKPEINKVVDRIVLKTPLIDWNKYNVECIKNLQKNVKEQVDPSIADQLRKIKEGEGKQVEFKTTLCFDIKENQKKDHIKFAIAKTLAAFLNTDGGLLYIGIGDNGNIEGLENDYQTFKSENKKDSFRRSLNNIIRYFIGNEYNQFIDSKFYSYNDKDFMEVTVNKSSFPVTLTYKGQKEFYIRGISSTEKLDIDQIIKWVLSNFRQDRK